MTFLGEMERPPMMMVEMDAAVVMKVATGSL
jgi:hypothetical protein